MLLACPHPFSTFLSNLRHQKYDKFDNALEDVEKREEKRRKDTWRVEFNPFVATLPTIIFMTKRRLPDKQYCVDCVAWQEWMPRQPAILQAI